MKSMECEQIVVLKTNYNFALHNLKLFYFNFCLLLHLDRLIDSASETVPFKFLVY